MMYVVGRNSCSKSAQFFYNIVSRNENKSIWIKRFRLLKDNSVLQIRCAEDNQNYTTIIDFTGLGICIERNTTSQYE